MEITEFWTICSSNGIVLEKEQLDMIKRYITELKYWNEKVNLISRKDVENILEKHVLHSLSILKYVDIPLKSRCLDVGTGGGLPGIPLSIARPDLNMQLIDSISKKMKMTEMFARHTGIKKLRTAATRAEELVKSKEHAFNYDFIFARAVSKLDVIVGWAKGLLKLNGKLVLLKGGDLLSEIGEARKLHNKLIVEEIGLELTGYQNFLKEGKKILICHFPKN